MRAKLNEKSSKQHTVRAAADVATNSCDVAVCSFVQWKSVLKFRDYPMHGRMKFLWVCAERACVRVCLCDENECDTLYNHPNEPRSKRKILI